MLMKQMFKYDVMLYSLMFSLVCGFLPHSLTLSRK